MTSIFAISFSNALVAAALALATAIVTRLWRSPQLAHALWMLVLLKLITPPMAVIDVPQNWLASRPLASERPTVEEPAAAAVENDLPAYFRMRYNSRIGRPRIVGLWSDPKTNSLVILGPPEADQPLRDELAEYETDWVGLGPAADDTLENQQALLLLRRRECIDEITNLKLKMLDLGEGADQADLKKL